MDWQDYSFAFTFYRYNASGVFIGSQKITAALELGASGDEFTTHSAVEVFGSGAFWQWGNCVVLFVAERRLTLARPFKAGGIVDESVRVA